MSTNPILVRNARPSDFPALADMEEAVWTPEKVEPLGVKHFEAWHRCYPEGFFVAESNGRLVGFTCLETVNFSLDAPLPNYFRTFNELTNNGYIEGVHQPNANHHFGPTICSIEKGAAHPLLRAILDLSAERKQPLLGASRMPGLHAYIETNGIDLKGDHETAVALHYVISCVKMAGGRAHPSLYAGFTPGRFPEVTAQDPVLKSYFRHQEFVFYCMLPGFLTDVKSHNFAVLFGQEQAE